VSDYILGREFADLDKIRISQKRAHAWEGTMALGSYFIRFSMSCHPDGVGFDLIIECRALVQRI
jgi:hypothetical protein